MCSQKCCKRLFSSLRRLTGNAWSAGLCMSGISRAVSCVSIVGRWSRPIKCMCASLYVAGVLAFKKLDWAGCNDVSQPHKPSIFYIIISSISPHRFSFFATFARRMCGGLLSLLLESILRFFRSLHNHSLKNRNYFLVHLDSYTHAYQKPTVHPYEPYVFGDFSSNQRARQRKRESIAVCESVSQTHRLCALMCYFHRLAVVGRTVHSRNWNCAYIQVHFGK